METSEIIGGGLVAIKAEDKEGKKSAEKIIKRKNVFNKDFIICFKFLNFYRFLIRETFPKKRKSKKTPIKIKEFKVCFFVLLFYCVLFFLF